MTTNQFAAAPAMTIPQYLGDESTGHGIFLNVPRVVSPLEYVKGMGLVSVTTPLPPQQHLSPQLYLSYPAGRSEYDLPCRSAEETRGWADANGGNGPVINAAVVVGGPHAPFVPSQGGRTTATHHLDGHAMQQQQQHPHVEVVVRPASDQGAQQGSLYPHPNAASPSSGAPPNGASNTIYIVVPQPQQQQEQRQVVLLQSTIRSSHQQHPTQQEPLYVFVSTPSLQPLPAPLQSVYSSTAGHVVFNDANVNAVFPSYAAATQPQFAFTVISPDASVGYTTNNLAPTESATLSPSVTTSFDSLNTTQDGTTTTSTVAAVRLGRNNAAELLTFSSASQTHTPRAENTPDADKLGSTSVAVGDATPALVTPRRGDCVPGNADYNALPCRVVPSATAASNTFFLRAPTPTVRVGYANKNTTATAPANNGSLSTAVERRAMAASGTPPEPTATASVVEGRSRPKVVAHAPSPLPTPTQPPALLSATPVVVHEWGRGRELISSLRKLSSDEAADAAFAAIADVDVARVAAALEVCPSLVLDLCHRQRGRIVCHAIERLGPLRCIATIATMIADFGSLSRHTSGSVAIMRLAAALRVAAPTAHNELFERCLAALDDLISHPCGSYVMGCFAVCGREDMVGRLAWRLTSSPKDVVGRAAFDRHGAFVVDTLLSHGSFAALLPLYDAIFHASATRLAKMCHDERAHAIVQSALESLERHLAAEGMAHYATERLPSEERPSSPNRANFALENERTGSRPGCGGRARAGDGGVAVVTSSSAAAATPVAWSLLTRDARRCAEAAGVAARGSPFAPGIVKRVESLFRRLPPSLRSA